MKGAATDMFGLQPPRHTSTLPNSAGRWDRTGDRFGSRIAVGMAIAGHPPHGSGRAQFGHPAPTLGV
jgi:hypothetical protein